MNKAVLTVPVLAAAAALVLAYSFLMPPAVQDCGQNSSCIQGLQNNIDECVPSSTIIQGRDNITLMVNITRVGDKCVRTEDVLDAPQNGYLIGNNVTCASNLSQLDQPESLICPGSLYDYVKPSGGGGGGGGPAPVRPPGIPVLDCAMDDNTCKDSGTQYIQGCQNSKMITTDMVWDPDGYWTLLINVTRAQDNCSIYIEVLNAVDIPPGIPSTLVGMNMTCSVPYPDFPLTTLKSEWCSGEFFDYIQYL